ncbi:MAG: DHA2 family efflux MFS transporter permease subunit [Alphaproteobacteria bacterium]|nr:DHA2 family efflux MFS transporter permease subunit [Alphaproteobacteria bacterium]
MGSISARQWLILLSVQFTTILFGLTATSATVILPQLKGALSATQEQISWVLTFNLVATAIATPLTGWLAATLGWRTLMALAVSGFTVASMLCGLVDSLEGLLALRVVQGAFGAPIFPMGQTILLASFHSSQHPFIIMMWGVGGVMGPILGPTFGGLIAEYLSWRWSFFLILPLGLLALVSVLAALSDQEKGTAARFDHTGFVFIAIAIAATQLLFDRGQRNDWFESTETVIELGAAVLFFTMFAIHVLTTRAPLFEPATFRNRNFAVGTTLALVMGMLQYAPMVLFPPLLQELQGYPDSLIGYLIAARGVGNFGSFFVVAQLTRLSPRLCLFIGLAIQAVAGMWMGSLDINLTRNDVMWSNVLHGFGFGLCYTPMAVLAFSTMPKRLLTQGNAIFSLTRMLGSSVFVSMILVVFTHSAAEANVNLSSAITVFTRDLIAPWMSALGHLGESHVQARLAAEIQRQASMVGYINAFHLMTLVPMLTAPLAFLFVTGRTADR